MSNENGQEKWSTRGIRLPWNSHPGEGYMETGPSASVFNNNILEWSTVRRIVRLRARVVRSWCHGKQYSLSLRWTICWEIYPWASFAQEPFKNFLWMAIQNAFMTETNWPRPGYSEREVISDIVFKQKRWSRSWQSARQRPDNLKYGTK